MNTQELFNKIDKYLENGIIPKVRVKKYYFEEGLDVGFTCEVHCAIIKDGCFEFTLVITPDLKELCLPFAINNWKMSGKTNLNYFDCETSKNGYYTEIAYIDLDDKDEYFDLINDKQEKLYQLFLKTNNKTSYLTWLENRLLLVNKVKNLS